MAPTRRVSKTLRSGGVANPAGESLASKAYEMIRDEILQGNLVVGAILSRRRLAEQLKMSFLPITEALQRLEADGLVESRPRIGTRVRIPTRQDIVDSYVIREALEVQAAYLSCELMTHAEREQLTQSARHLDNLYRAGASENEDSRFLFSVHTYHMQFHMRIAELARCPGLLKAIEKEQVLIFNWLYDTAAHRKSLPVHFHLNLANAVCSANRSLAVEAMREHIRFGLNNVVESLGNLEVSRGWRLKRGD
jgi:DNA-binding GntR family transcriptional regulator